MKLDSPDIWRFERPQGSVLEPSLFLFCINDMPQGLKSTVRLFTDDAIAYLTITSENDALALQTDLNKLTIGLTSELQQYAFCFTVVDPMLRLRRRNPSVLFALPHIELQGFQKILGRKHIYLPHAQTAIYDSKVKLFLKRNIPSTWSWLNAVVRFECENSAIPVLLPV
jgi:hypothetical protein